jgi:hypothetical protein
MTQAEYNAAYAALAAEAERRMGNLREGQSTRQADRESALAELEAAQAEHAAKARVVGALMGAANAELEEDAL